jgi:hypothetical protein
LLDNSIDGMPDTMDVLDLGAAVFACSWSLPIHNVLMVLEFHHLLNAFCDLTWGYGVFEDRVSFRRD